MTQEEATVILKRIFCAGEDMAKEIIDNGSQKEETIKNIKSCWDGMVKWAKKDKDLQVFYRNQCKEIIAALTGEDTTPHAKYNKDSETEKDIFAEKLLKFMKKNWSKDNLKPDETYENIVKRMIDAI